MNRSIRNAPRKSALEQRHRALDRKIGDAERSISACPIEIKQLKKQRLVLREQIFSLR